MDGKSEGIRFPMSPLVETRGQPARRRFRPNAKDYAGCRSLIDFKMAAMASAFGLAP